MPDYPPPGTTTRGITIYSGIPGSYISAPSGYKQLSPTIGPGRSVEVQSLWLQNNHATQAYRLMLSRVPKGWIGATSDPLLRVIYDFKLTPGQLLVLNATVGLSDGDALWGFQYLDGVLSDVSVGINMIAAGKVVG